MAADAQSAQREYERLVVALHREIRAGRADGDEADRLRDRMDRPWGELSDDARRLLGLLSEDLYEIAGNRLPVAASPTDTLELLSEAKTAMTEHPDRTLALLRRVPDGALPTDVRLYMLARCWSRLGFSVAAAELLDGAYARAPRSNYAVMALSALADAGELEELTRRIATIEASSEVEPALALRAAALLFQIAEKAPTSDQPSILRRVIALVERGSSSAETLPSLRAAALVAAGFSYERLADRERALRTFDEAIATHEHDSALIGRGLVRLAVDREAALADFERAVVLGTQLPWPYVYLAHDALQRADYERVELLCAEGLSRATRPSVRAELFEWSAIAGAQLGRRHDLVLERFSSAIAEDPFNERIRRNASAFESARRGEPVQADVFRLEPPDDARVRRSLGRETAQTLGRAA